MKRTKEGFFLPVVAVMMMLVMLSVLMVANFGSETRNLLRQAESRELCRMATISALTEVRSAVTRELRQEKDDWPEWWQKLLPPYSAPLTTPAPTIEAPATHNTFLAHEVTLEDITIRCLDRRTGHRVKSQGLLEFRATASRVVGRTEISFVRSERYRFYVQYETTESTPDPDNPAVSYPTMRPTISLFPLSTSEGGQL